MDPDPQHPHKHTTALKELSHQIKFAQRLGGDTQRWIFYNV
jgi:hypothetical protein